MISSPKCSFCPLLSNGISHKGVWIFLKKNRFWRHTNTPGVRRKRRRGGKKKFSENDERTRKHLREMEALVNHNIYLSQFGKKILYSNGFAAKFKTQTKNNLYC